MAELWFALLCLTLILFVVLDGWNIGAGVLHLIVAKSDRERRQVIAALGPTWSWNEVWLVAAGGTFVLAFPRIMAVSFAGFYLALWLVLWSFVLRGISIEVGGHIHDTLWQSAWDFVFAAVERAPRGAVRRGVRQRDPRRAAGRNRTVQHVALHRLRSPWPGRDSRLVHAFGRRVHDGTPGGARRDVPEAQDDRTCARAERSLGSPALDSRRPCCSSSSRCKRRSSGPTSSER